MATALISGETNQILIANVNGNYLVQLAENGCTINTNCVSITTVKIKYFSE
jgi:hypothetical protein